MEHIYCSNTAASTEAAFIHSVNKQFACTPQYAKTHYLKYKDNESTKIEMEKNLAVYSPTKLNIPVSLSQFSLAPMKL